MAFWDPLLQARPPGLNLKSHHWYLIGKQKALNAISWKQNNLNKTDDDSIWIRFYLNKIWFYLNKTDDGARWKRFQILEYFNKVLQNSEKLTDVEEETYQKTKQ